MPADCDMLNAGGNYGLYQDEINANECKVCPAGNYYLTWSVSNNRFFRLLLHLDIEISLRGWQVFYRW